MDNELSGFTDSEIEDEYDRRGLGGCEFSSFGSYSDQQILDEVSERGLEEDVVGVDFDIGELAEKIRQDMNSEKCTTNRVRALIEAITGKLVFV